MHIILPQFQILVDSSYITAFFQLALQQELSGMMNRLRDASGLAEQKESEVEKLKREKRHLIWTVIYLRSFLVKYGELRQALDMAEKERQFDLKEREALVYRAEALQREFDHTNKLLQVIGDHDIRGELFNSKATGFLLLRLYLLTEPIINP